MPVRVLVCDDSRLMRRLLSTLLQSRPGFLVVGEAQDGEECLRQIQDTRPDVVILDLNMPRMDGISCLRAARARNLDPAFLVVSSNARQDAPITLEALNEGAFDYVAKDQEMLQLERIQDRILAKIQAAHAARSDARRRESPPEAKEDGPAASATARFPHPGPEAPGGGWEEPSAIVPATAGEAAGLESVRGGTISAAAPSSRKPVTLIGGGAGAVQMLPLVLANLPADFQDVLVVVLKIPEFLTRHMPAQYARLCPLPLRLISEGEPVVPGRVYVAPGGQTNLILARDPDSQRVVFRLVPPNHPDDECPSLDAALKSMAAMFKEGCRGILASGTGRDGLDGLLAVQEEGGDTLVQDPATALSPLLPQAALAASISRRTVTPLQIAGLLSPTGQVRPRTGSPPPTAVASAAPAVETPVASSDGRPLAARLAPSGPVGIAAGGAKASAAAATGALATRCGACLAEIRPLDRINCPACKQPHHETCWSSAGGCSHAECSRSRTRASAIPTSNDVKPPGGRAASLLKKALATVVVLAVAALAVSLASRASGVLDAAKRVVKSIDRDLTGLGGADASTAPKPNADASGQADPGRRRPGPQRSPGDDGHQAGGRRGVSPAPRGAAARR